VTESHTAVKEDTAIIRAPMGESIGHAFDNRWIYWVSLVEVYDPAYCAHRVLSSQPRFQSKYKRFRVGTSEKYPDRHNSRCGRELPVLG
jgi:hypothetical protein